jgi:hypothetical protein
LFGLAVPSEHQVLGCRDQGAVGSPVEPLVGVGELSGEPQLPGLVEPLEGHPGGAQVGAVELDPLGWRGAGDVGGTGPDPQLGHPVCEQLAKACLGSPLLGATRPRRRGWRDVPGR